MTPLFEMTGDVPVSHSCEADTYQEALALFSQKYGVEPETVIMNGTEIHGVCAFCNGLIEGGSSIAQEVYGAKKGAMFHGRECYEGEPFDAHFKRLIAFREGDPSWKIWCDNAKKSLAESVHRDEKNARREERKKLPWYKRYWRG